MSVIVVVGLVLAILASLLLARRARRAGDKISAADAHRPRTRPTRPVGKMLRTGAECCEAARNTSELWFKVWDAPSLPLANCDRRKGCHCAWERHYDRRVSERRVGLERRQILRFGTTHDRRSGNERRVERQDNWKAGVELQDNWKAGDDADR